MKQNNMSTETTYEVVEIDGKPVLREEMPDVIPIKEGQSTADAVSDYQQRQKPYPISGFIAPVGTKGLREGKDFQFKEQWICRPNGGKAFKDVDVAVSISPTTERLKTKEEILKSHIDGGSYSDGENLILVSEALAAMEEFAFQFKEEINRLTISNMAHEYNEAEAARYGEPSFTPPSEEEIEEEIEKLYPIDLNEHQMRINHQTDEFDVTQQMAANDATIARREGFKACARWMIEKQKQND